MTPAGPVLRDIHLPPPASWWPLAPGWWALAALLVIAAGLLIWHAHRRRLPRRRWHAARRELAQLQASHSDDHVAFAAGVSQLLRRAARLHDPVAVSLRGAAWRATLRRLAGSHVATQPLENLDAVMYARGTTMDTAAVAAAARTWLRRVLLRGGTRA